PSYQWWRINKDGTKALISTQDLALFQVQVSTSQKLLPLSTTTIVGLTVGATLRLFTVTNFGYVSDVVQRLGKPTIIPIPYSQRVDTAIKCYVDSPATTLCAAFGPYGCNNTALNCVRQTLPTPDGLLWVNFTMPSVWPPVGAPFIWFISPLGAGQNVSIQVRPSDICCPRGYIGNYCEIPVG